jgi:uncharacterized protein YfaQ (DUF2300 family)
VLTHCGTVERGGSWPAVGHDVLARRWRKQLQRLPRQEDARLALARAVLEAAGEVSAPDLAAALGWRRAPAAEALAELTDQGVAREREDGIRLWIPRRHRSRDR